jgi:hypothetical protein
VGSLACDQCSCIVIANSVVVWIPDARIGSGPGESGMMFKRWTVTASAATRYRPPPPKSKTVAAGFIRRSPGPRPHRCYCWIPNKKSGCLPYGARCLGFIGSLSERRHNTRRVPQHPPRLSGRHADSDPMKRPYTSTQSGRAPRPRTHSYTAIILRATSSHE